MFLLDGFADVFHFNLTVLLAVFLHCDGFFFFQGACPDFNVVYLLVLLLIVGFTLLAQDILVVVHDLIVVEVIFTTLKVLDVLLANFLDTTGKQLLKDFTSANLALSVQLVHKIILSTLLLVKDLLSFKVSLSLLLVEFALLDDLFLFLLKIAVDLLLVLSHLIFECLNLGSFFIKLLLDLQEDTLALLSLVFGVADASKGSA